MYGDVVECLGFNMVVLRRIVKVLRRRDVGFEFFGRLMRFLLWW